MRASTRLGNRVVGLTIVRIGESFVPRLFLHRRSEKELVRAHTFIADTGATVAQPNDDNDAAANDFVPDYATAPASHGNEREIVA